MTLNIQLNLEKKIIRAKIKILTIGTVEDPEKDSQNSQQ